MNLLNTLPASFWQVITACGVGFACLWWFILGAPRAARRRALRVRIAALGPAESSSELAELQRLHETIARARQTLQRTPAVAGRGEVLYRIPWFLFIGDTAADVPGLLAAAHSVSPLPAPETQDTAGKAFWRWWFLDAITAIETSPATVCDIGSRRARSLWYQALMELTEQRDRLPLNGMVLCIGTAGLLGAPGDIEPGAARLRRLVDEATEQLQIRLPVYLIVTGLEQLAGYETVRAALPPEVLAQALGHRLPLQGKPADEAQDDRLGALFRPIQLRLHGLRMALLCNETTPAGRLAIHTFFDQVNALQPGLQRVVNRMFEERHGRRPPRWRGLYLTAVQPETGGAFVSDLFGRFLPSDQPLARR